MKGVDYERLTALGTRIVTAAKAVHIHTQAELAREVGATRAVVNQWLYDPLRKPDGVKTLKLAEALKCSPRYLAGLSNDPTPMVSVTGDESALLKAYKKLKPMQRARLIRDALERAEDTAEQEES